MKVSLPAFLLVIESDRYDGEALVKFRNGQPVQITLLTGKPIPLESPANGSRRAPTSPAPKEAPPHLR